VSERFPDLKLVTTHLGSMNQWQEVESLLAGRKIYMEISFSLELLGPGRAKEILLKHPKDYILFGTDSPWVDQSKALSGFMELDLGADMNTAILRDNAQRLLESV
jgi:predicted TIM-barrel fold metal-dependent hydrolase